MKIRKISPDDRNKVYGLFRKEFSGSNIELNVLQKLHLNNRDLHEWVCIHTNKSIAYIAFSNAYNGTEICGLHLIHLVVNPDFKGRGIAAELLSFALRQKEVQSSTVFVLGDSQFYTRFGFELASNPNCPFTGKRKQFLSIRNRQVDHYTIAYDPEYKVC